MFLNREQCFGKCVLVSFCTGNTQHPSTHTHSSEPVASLSTDNHRPWDLETFHSLVSTDASQWCTSHYSNLPPHAEQIKLHWRKGKHLIFRKRLTHSQHKKRKRVVVRVKDCTTDTDLQRMRICLGFSCSGKMFLPPQRRLCFCFTLFVWIDQQDSS